MIIRLPSASLSSSAQRICPLEKEDRRVNAKSLLGVLSLGIVKGTVVTLIADGADEDEAIATLSALIDSDFSE